VKDGRLLSPSGHCLHGVTRLTVLEAAAEHGIEAEVRDIPLAEFLEADEVFTATSGGGIAPVTKINGRVFSNGAEGPVTGRLAAAYWAMTQRDALREAVAAP
ncbi:MAG: aminotransferase class IV, partial [Pseudomonadota bacterium]